MFRSPWELDALVRYRNADIASECRRCSRIDWTEIGMRRRLARLRRSVGIGLIQVGTTIAGRDALLPPQARPKLANR